ncbi:oxidoreductase, 2OG-Fe(II) oxygenase [Chitinophaga silvatica]|uniref:Oxidoreductase, 2OG-Fe(II) oxygenase n=1 Tax=Chitinophaga silvatica TaxID=2282649 RepID=A0A3E1Y4P9_9BACT|nr:2OG-Fe(II) oxygenase [Chitinophaga silvatica]RFS19664.1 oxidoreductase, 2OG-Fe(II) oxygenase [Chitinophaga silvatica]
MNNATLTTVSPEIFIINNFLTREECATLIEKSEAVGYEEAKIQMGDGTQRLVKSVRNNERVFSTDLQLAQDLAERVLPFAPKGHGNCQPIGLNELFRFYRYKPGQRFRMHPDNAYVRNVHEASQYTFLIYLNDGYTGGETIFATGEVIRPSTGMALMFYHPLRHEGAMLTEGVKYVIRTDIMYKQQV